MANEGIQWIQWPSSTSTSTTTANIMYMPAPVKIVRIDANTQAIVNAAQALLERLKVEVVGRNHAIAVDIRSRRRSHAGGAVQLQPPGCARRG